MNIQIKNAINKDYIKDVFADLLDEYSELDENGLHDPKWCGVSECCNAIDSAPQAVLKLGKWKEKEGFVTVNRIIGKFNKL